MRLGRGLLIGPEQIMRIDLAKTVPTIELDDWRGTVDLLPGPAADAVQSLGDRAAGMFLREQAGPYIPVAVGNGTSAGRIRP
jgi:hypothetical protein